MNGIDRAREKSRGRPPKNSYLSTPMASGVSPKKFHLHLCPRVPPPLLLLPGELRAFPSPRLSNNSPLISPTGRRAIPIPPVGPLQPPPLAVASNSAPPLAVASNSAPPLAVASNSAPPLAIPPPTLFRRSPTPPFHRRRDLLSTVQPTMTRTTYVVFIGKRPGIYNEWHECHMQVNGFKGCLYKSYKTYEEAEMEFLKFWGMSGVDEASTSSLNQSSVLTGSSSIAQSSTHQAALPNEGGTRYESQRGLENIIYILAIAVLILSLKIVFG